MGRALAGLELPAGPRGRRRSARWASPNARPPSSKGDAKVAAIAAASILAKVDARRPMVRLAADHPEYGFEINKGYGTPEHLAALAPHGLCPDAPALVHARAAAPSALF